MGITANASQVQVHTGASAPFPTYSAHSKASCPHAGFCPREPHFQVCLPWIQSGYLASSEAGLPLGVWPLQTMAGLRACVSIPVVQLQAGRSDLGPPAFDELHDLLDLKLGEVEVVCQDVLTELYKDAAIDTFSGKEAHHVL